MPLVDRQRGNDQDGSDVDIYRGADLFGQRCGGQVGPAGRIRGNHDDDDLLRPGRPDTDRGGAADPGHDLYGLLDADGGDRARRRRDDVDHAALDPQPPFLVQVPDVTAAVPVQRLLAPVLGHPELVVGVLRVRGPDAHLTHDLGLGRQRAGGVPEVVERAYLDQDLGDRGPDADAVARAGRLDPGRRDVGDRQHFGHAVRRVGHGVRHEVGGGAQHGAGNGRAGGQEQADAASAS